MNMYGFKIYKRHDFVFKLVKINFSADSRDCFFVCGLHADFKLNDALGRIFQYFERFIGNQIACKFAVKFCVFGVFDYKIKNFVGAFSVRVKGAVNEFNQRNVVVNKKHKLVLNACGIKKTHPIALARKAVTAIIRAAARRFVVDNFVF